MAFIGNTNTTQGFIPAIDYFSGNGSSVAFTLSRPVASVYQFIVSIDNVIQNPSSAYSVSGTTLTFTSAPLAGTNNIWVEYTSPITQTIAPGQGTVTTSSLASSTGSGAVVLQTSPTITTPTISSLTSAAATNLTLQSAGTTALTIDTSQRVSFVAGTAAAPAITTTGDTNTGMFFPEADTIAFAEGGAEAMRLDSSGNVGIGTTSPSTYGKFAVAGNNQTNILTSFAGGTAFQAYCDDSTGEVRLKAADVTSTNTKYMTFYTNPSGSSSGTERMRVDSSGNVLVARTSAYSDGSIGTPVFQVSSLVGARAGGAFISNSTSSVAQIGFVNPNGTVGAINSSGSSTSYVTSSDYRLKENITPMTGALDKVALLKPVSYKWKVDGSDGQGFIAHELQAIIPDCVSGEKDAVDAEGNPIHQGVDTSFLVATLTAAIQEQQTIINNLKARIETLEGGK